MENITMAGYNGYIGGVKHKDGVPTVTAAQVARAAEELAEVYKDKIANTRYESGRSLTRSEADARIARYNGYIADLQHKARIA